jgi:hypothetical protein
MIEKNSTANQEFPLELLAGQNEARLLGTELAKYDMIITVTMQTMAITRYGLSLFIW